MILAEDQSARKIKAPFLRWYNAHREADFVLRTTGRAHPLRLWFIAGRAERSRPGCGF